MFVGAIVASRTVPLEEGLACGSVRIEAEPVLAFQEVAEAKVPLCVLRRVQDLGSDRRRLLHLCRHVLLFASQMGRLQRVII